MTVPNPKPWASQPGTVPHTTPTYRVRAPEDFFALAPIVVGFQPAQSIVMLTFGATRPFHARVDLPPRHLLTTPADAHDLAETLLRPARAHGVRDVVLLFYSADVRGAVPAFRALRRGCRAAGIGIIDALHTDGRRYHPLLGADRRLCETGIPYDVSAHPFTAQAVLSGRVVHPSREAMTAVLDADDAAVRAVEAVLAGDLDDDRLPDRIDEILEAGTWVAGLVARHVADRTVATDGEVARLVRMCSVERVRNAAWTLMRRANADAHLQFWVDVVRRTPEPLVAAPAALAGWAAWLAGDGALAWAAIDRCYAVAPTYGLAGLLADALTDAVPPELGEPSLDWKAGISGPEPAEPA